MSGQLQVNLRAFALFVTVCAAIAAPNSAIVAPPAERSVGSTGVAPRPRVDQPTSQPSNSASPLSSSPYALALDQMIPAVVRGLVAEGMVEPGDAPQQNGPWDFSPQPVAATLQSLVQQKVLLVGDNFFIGSKNDLTAAPSKDGLSIEFRSPSRGLEFSCNRGGVIPGTPLAGLRIGSSELEIARFVEQVYADAVAATAFTEVNLDGTSVGVAVGKALKDLVGQGVITSFSIDTPNRVVRFSTQQWGSTTFFLATDRINRTEAATEARLFEQQIGRSASPGVLAGLNPATCEVTTAKLMQLVDNLAAADSTARGDQLRKSVLEAFVGPLDIPPSANPGGTSGGLLKMISSLFVSEAYAQTVTPKNRKILNFEGYDYNVVNNGITSTQLNNPSSLIAQELRDKLGYRIIINQEFRRQQMTAPYGLGSALPRLFDQLKEADTVIAQMHGDPFGRQIIARIDEHTNIRTSVLDNCNQVKRLLDQRGIKGSARDVCRKDGDTIAYSDLVMVKKFPEYGRILSFDSTVLPKLAKPSAYILDSCFGGASLLDYVQDVNDIVTSLTDRPVFYSSIFGAQATAALYAPDILRIRADIGGQSNYCKSSAGGTEPFLGKYCELASAGRCISKLSDGPSTINNYGLVSPGRTLEDSLTSRLPDGSALEAGDTYNERGFIRNKERVIKGNGVKVEFAPTVREINRGVQSFKRPGHPDEWVQWPSVSFAFTSPVASATATVTPHNCPRSDLGDFAALAGIQQVVDDGQTLAVGVGEYPLQSGFGIGSFFEATIDQDDEKVLKKFQDMYGVRPSHWNAYIEIEVTGRAPNGAPLTGNDGGWLYPDWQNSCEGVSPAMVQMGNWDYKRINVKIPCEKPLAATKAVVQLDEEGGGLRKNGETCQEGVAESKLSTAGACELPGRDPETGELYWVAVFEGGEIATVYGQNDCTYFGDDNQFKPGRFSSFPQTRLEGRCCDGDPESGGESSNGTNCPMYVDEALECPPDSPANSHCFNRYNQYRRFDGAAGYGEVVKLAPTYFGPGKPVHE